MRSTLRVGDGARSMRPKPEYRHVLATLVAPASESGEDGAESESEDQYEDGCESAEEVDEKDACEAWCRTTWGWEVVKVWVVEGRVVGM